MNTDKLKALALAATPGPWKYDEDNGLGIFPENGRELIEYLTIGNARYIAAANPAAILELIASHDELLDSLSYMVSNQGQLNSLETRDGFKKARELVKKLKEGEA